MSHASEAALQRLLPLLRQLRGVTGLREVKPGTFHFRGTAFVHFHEQDGAILADLKKFGGTAFDRYPVDSPVGQRKLFEDAKRRVLRADDE